MFSEDHIMIFNVFSPLNYLILNQLNQKIFHKLMKAEDSEKEPGNRYKKTQTISKIYNNSIQRRDNMK
jgi:hypothetical protein